MSKIMIIEDDEVLSLELKELLTLNGYEVELVKDFKNTIDAILNYNPDLLLLDINIPYLNGEVILQNLRKKSNVPVIMVTSRNTDMDEALSISLGADDYITKPYNPNILLLRINAILKRVNRISNIINYKTLIINTQNGTIKNQDKEIILTKNEMIIFAYLLNNKDKIVKRDELMTSLWNNEEFINDNALTVNISRLRSKLSKLGYNNIIETRKGQGYIIS